MDFETLFAKRESCRSYKDIPVEREKLEKIVEMGRLAPSACNAQPWKYIIIDEQQAKEKLLDAFDDDGVNCCKWGTSVPAFIVICEEYANLIPKVRDRLDSQHFAQIDIGLTAMTMCYGAVELGLSTGMIGVVNQKKMQKAFGIPEDKTVRLVIAVGYGEDGEPRKKVRKELDEIRTYNYW